MHPSVRQFVRAVTRPAPAAVRDPDLLCRFVDTSDEEAFGELVRRHGPMVLDVCRAALGNRADAEDAFQATFLVLARRAGSIRKVGSLAAWLHGVAHRTAHKARVRAARRRRHEAGAPVREPTAPDDLSRAEVRRLVLQELAALPDRYRVPLVSCYLEGQTQEQAAAALGLSAAAVKKRLERGRQMLRAALTRRGLGPAAVLTVLAAPAAAPAVPPDLIASATRLVATPTGAIPPHVLALAEGGLTPMIPTKLHAVLLAAAVAGLGTALFAGGQPDRPMGGVALATEAEAEADDTPAAKETKWLAGAWRVRHVETHGEALLTAEELAKARITFRGDRAEMKGFRVTFVRDFSFKLDPTKQPKQIDVTFLDGPRKGETFEGIYVVRQSEMRICLRLADPESGRPKGFVTSGGKTLYTFILEPIEEKSPPPVIPARKSDQPPAKVADRLEARTVLKYRGKDTGPQVLTPVVEVENQSTHEYELLFDPKDVEWRLTDRAGKVVTPRPGTAAPAVRGLIPPGGYVGFPTHRGGVLQDERTDVFVAGGRVWMLAPGKYTVQGTATVTVTFPGPELSDESRTPVRESEAPARRLPARKVKLDLKPVTFEVGRW